MHKLFLKNSNGDILTNSNGDAIYFSLPEAYQEVEYIEGGSGQYIITELNFNHTSTLEIYGKSYFTSTGTRGCSASEYANGSQLGLEFISGLRVYNSGNPDFNNNGFTFNTPNEYYVNFNRTAQTITSICNGNVITKTGLYGNNGTNFYLFVDRALRFSTFNKTHRMYYFKMIKDGNMYCYLISCYRKSDNVIGMYDLVNKVFYTNAGSGTFVKGPRIPEEYQEVEYIQSSGTQYIDTKTAIGDDFELILDQMNNFDTGNHYMCGSSSSGRMLGTLTNRLWTNGVIHSTVNIGKNVRQVVGCHIIAQGSNGNDFVMTNYTTNSSYSGHSSYNIPSTAYYVYLFRVGGAYESFKCYNFKIKDSGHLLRNLIPCYRKSDNVIGMYDKVEDKFYTNSGTGTFTKGEDVN